MRDQHVILMGVSGCGKSTLGRLLATEFDRLFIEGDDFHPQSNIEKMASGQPLDNADRRAWIEALCQSANKGSAAIIACSALNLAVRSWLKAGLDRSPLYIWLDAPSSLLAERLEQRPDHFFGPSLLSSQFEALEPPQDAIRVSVDQSVDLVLSAIKSALDKQG